MLENTYCHPWCRSMHILTLQMYANSHILLWFYDFSMHNITLGGVVEEKAKTNKISKNHCKYTYNNVSRKSSILRFQIGVLWKLIPYNVHIAFYVCIHMYVLEIVWKIILTSHSNTSHWPFTCKQPRVSHTATFRRLDWSAKRKLYYKSTFDVYFLWFIHILFIFFQNKQSFEYRSPLAGSLVVNEIYSDECVLMRFIPENLSDAV